MQNTHRPRLFRRWLCAVLLTCAAGVTAAAPEAKPFVHPGLLHTEQDFLRMRHAVARGTQPWQDGWQRLTANPHASLKWNARPQAVVYRGRNPEHAENYAALFNDAAVEGLGGRRLCTEGHRHPERVVSHAHAH